MSHKKFPTLLLLLTIITLSMLIPGLLNTTPWINSTTFYIINTAILVLICTFLFKINFTTFVPALFFLIFYTSGPLIKLQAQLIPLQYPGVLWIIPIGIYLSLALSIKKMKQEIHWLKWGRIDRLTKLLILLTTTISGIALIIWAFVINKDMTSFQRMIPQVPLILLFFGGIIFAITNALAEEFFARAVLWDGLSPLTRSTLSLILSQAIIFGLFHSKGFPGGIVGIGMTFLWSLMLGYLRHRTGGLGAPLIAHFFADLTIFSIIFCTLL